MTQRGNQATGWLPRLAGDLLIANKGDLSTIL